MVSLRERITDAHYDVEAAVRRAKDTVVDTFSDLPAAAKRNANELVSYGAPVAIGGLGLVAAKVLGVGLLASTPVGWALAVGGAGTLMLAAGTYNGGKFDGSLIGLASANSPEKAPTQVAKAAEPERVAQVQPEIVAPQTPARMAEAGKDTPSRGA